MRGGRVAAANSKYKAPVLPAVDLAGTSMVVHYEMKITEALSIKAPSEQHSVDLNWLCF